MNMLLPQTAQSVRAAERHFRVDCGKDRIQHADGIYIPNRKAWMVAHKPQSSSRIIIQSESYNPKLQP